MLWSCLLTLVIYLLATFLFNLLLCIGLKIKMIKSRGLIVNSHRSLQSKVLKLFPLFQLVNLIVYYGLFRFMLYHFQVEGLSRKQFAVIYLFIIASASLLRQISLQYQKSEKELKEIDRENMVEMNDLFSDHIIKDNLKRAIGSALFVNTVFIIFPSLQFYII